MSPTRREFLRGLAGVAGVAALGGRGLDTSLAGPRPARVPPGRLPVPEQSGIDHVIVNGTEIVDHGEFTEARPGTLLRSGRDTETVSVPGGDNE